MREEKEEKAVVSSFGACWEEPGCKDKAASIRRHSGLL